MGTTGIQGEFEHHVLLATVRLGPSSYTAALVVELEERTGREVSPSAVYVALRRLEKKGLVRSSLHTGDGPGALRERRFFEATEEGVRALRESRERFLSLWNGLDPVVGDGTP